MGFLDKLGDFALGATQGAATQLPDTLRRLDQNRFRNRQLGVQEDREDRLRDKAEADRLERQKTTIRDRFQRGDQQGALTQAKALGFTDLVEEFEGRVQVTGDQADTAALSAIRGASAEVPFADSTEDLTGLAKTAAQASSDALRRAPSKSAGGQLGFLFPGQQPTTAIRDTTAEDRARGQGAKIVGGDGVLFESANLQNQVTSRLQQVLDKEEREEQRELERMQKESREEQTQFFMDIEDPFDRLSYAVAIKRPDLEAEARKMLERSPGPLSAADRRLVDAVKQDIELFDVLSTSDKARIGPTLVEEGVDITRKPSNAVVNDIARGEAMVEKAMVFMNEIADGRHDAGFGSLDQFKQFAPSGFFEDAKDTQSRIDGIRQDIAKELEGGVLRLADEEKYKRILPKASDSPEAARRKMRNALLELRRDISIFIKNQREQGVRIKPHLRLVPNDELAVRALNGDENAVLEYRRRKEAGRNLFKAQQKKQ